MSQKTFFDFNDLLRGGEQLILRADKNELILDRFPPDAGEQPAPVRREFLRITHHHPEHLAISHVEIYMGQQGVIEGKAGACAGALNEVRIHIPAYLWPVLKLAIKELE